MTPTENHKESPIILKRKRKTERKPQHSAKGRPTQQQLRIYWHWIIVVKYWFYYFRSMVGLNWLYRCLLFYRIVSYRVVSCLASFRKIVFIPTRRYRPQSFFFLCLLCFTLLTNIGGKFGHSSAAPVALSPSGAHNCLLPCALFAHFVVISAHTLIHQLLDWWIRLCCASNSKIQHTLAGMHPVVVVFIFIILSFYGSVGSLRPKQLQNLIAFKCKFFF